MGAVFRPQESSPRYLRRLTKTDPAFFCWWRSAGRQIVSTAFRSAKRLVYAAVRNAINSGRQRAGQSSVGRPRQPLTYPQQERAKEAHPASAPVVELADTSDLRSDTAWCEGSSPSGRTRRPVRLRINDRGRGATGFSGQDRR